MDTNQATRLAAQIESDIRSSRLVAGTIIGTKPELASQYGVGPEVFRQAARLLEQRGIAQMRRGKLGGLVVATQRIDSVAHALAAFLEFANVPFTDFLTLDDTLHAATFKPSSLALNLQVADGMRRRLQACVDSGGGVWRSVFTSFDIRQELVDLIKNPVLSLVHQSVMFFFLDMLPIEEIGESELSVGIKFHLRNTIDFVDAMTANDINAAIRVAHENRDYLSRKKSLWAPAEAKTALSKSRRNDFGPMAEKWTGRRTLADRVARQLLRDIRRRGWPEGVCLGTENELLQTYGVSRATFRQAVRILEHYSAAEMLRGPKGGLVIKSPDPDKLVEATASYLKRAGAGPNHARPLQIELYMSAVDILSAKASARALHELKDCYGSMRSLRKLDLRHRLAQFHSLIFSHTENRVLDVYSSILFRLVSSSDIPLSIPDKRILAAVNPAFDAFLQSLSDSDRPRARRAMLDYLFVENEWLNAQGAPFS